MKKTKRATRARSVRHTKKAEATGATGLIWALLVLVVAGAIGWYAFQQTGGTTGAKAGVTANPVGPFQIVAQGGYTLRVGQSDTFYVQDSTGRHFNSAKYSWYTVSGTAAAKVVQTVEDPTIANVTALAVNDGIEGYVNVLVDITLGTRTYHAGRLVTIKPWRVVGQVSIAPLLTNLPLGESRTLTASSLDTDNKRSDNTVMYKWLIVNHSANGTFGAQGAPDIREAGTAQVTIRASKVSSGGGWFNVLLGVAYPGAPYKWTGTVVWVEPAAILSSVSISPKVATIGSGKTATFYANALDDKGAKMTDTTITWSAVGVLGAKTEIVSTRVDTSGTSWATVKVTLPTGRTGVALPVIATAKKGTVTKTDTASLTVHM